MSNGPSGRPARPAARTKEERVAGRDFDSGDLFPRLDVLRINRCTRFRIRHAFETGKIDEDASREDPVLKIDDRIPGVAVLHHAGSVGLVPVVEDAAVMDVRQRIEVGVGDAVWDDAIRSVPISIMRCRMDRGCRWLSRCPHPVRVRRRFLLDESNGLPPFNQRNQIQRADLIVLAPASPVRELRLPPLEVCARDRLRRPRRHCAFAEIAAIVGNPIARTSASSRFMSFSIKSLTAVSTAVAFRPP